LPQNGDGRQQAGGDQKEGRNEGTEGAKGGDEFGRAKKFTDPREAPIVPVKPQPGDEQPVGEQGEPKKEFRDRVLSRFEQSCLVMGSFYCREYQL